jgi:LysM repeat protein
MNAFKRIAALGSIVLILVMTGCNMTMSTPPAATPTVDGLTDPDFPFDPADVSVIATQTAMALEPGVIDPLAPGGDAPEGPDVQVSTPTPDEAGEPPATDQPAPDTQEPVDQPGDTGATEPPPAPAPLPTPVLERPETYTIQQGEFPYCIARRYDLDPGSFLSLNGLNNNSRPVAGTTLRIPATGNWPTNLGSRSLQSHPTTYNVQANDSVYSIACRFGSVSPEAILAANGMSSPSDLRSGTQITIP